MSQVNTLKLTDAQAVAAVELYNAGITQYTKIAKKLKLPYVAVNKFMTNWKRKHGILKSRKAVSKVSAQRKSEAAPAIGKSMDSVSASELVFLRKFYIKTLKSELNG